MGQELWLTEKQLPVLQQLGTQFVARSGMEDAVASGILRGRPFGGVSIAWSPHLDHLIKPLSNFRHKRVVGVELCTGDNNFLLICVYMPFFDSSRRAICMADSLDAITMVETMIEQHPLHSIIIGGDMNCEFRGESPFDPLWEELQSRFQLTCCDNFLPAGSITYRHNSLNQKKLNDHFIVSKSLLDANLLSNHNILDHGDNPSDHLPIVMSLATQFQMRVQEQNVPPSKEILKWEKISEQQKSLYADRLSHLLERRPAPAVWAECREVCRCDAVSCVESLQNEYDFLMQCLAEADKSLPRHKPGIQKEWWTRDLTDLRNKSIDIQSLWIEQGRPRSGPTHEERLRVRAAYKRAIRAAQRAPKQAAWDRLHSSLSEKDTNSFWRSWKSLYNKNKSHLAPVVNGCSSKQAIANSFKDSFRNNCTPNNQLKVDSLNCRFSESYTDYKVNHAASCDCSSFSISMCNIIDAICSMKAGKCADEDGISAEHFLNAPLSFLTRLVWLFNSMLKHAYVPKQFRLGFMVPILKDQQGNHADISNYRGITISPIASKVFEHCLKIVFCEFLSTSEMQFGFKKDSSTVHALHCLKQTTNYFINNGSRVFCGFLDASKAFDRVVHSGLYIKLIQKKVPLVLLDIIISWYGDLLCRVKWGDTYSDWFAVTAGVRQGGILSPDFYSIYTDDLIAKLKALKKGCYFFGNFAAALFYADDVAVLAPSIKGLIALLNACKEYCAEWDIGLNAKKSKLLYFGKRIETIYDVYLNGVKIEWVNEWTYLGVTLKCGPRFSCSVVEKVKKFYRCANAIFRIDGVSNDTVMLHLVETHCVPILTYAAEVVHVINRDEKRSLRVAYNSLFRRIFGYRWTESVTALQAFLDRPTWEQLVERRQTSFERRLSNCNSQFLANALMLWHMH